MAAKEIKENPKTINVNFISFQKQLREIIKDIKDHNKRSGMKKVFGSKHNNPHVDGSILLQDAPDNKVVAKLVKQLDKDPNNAEARLLLVNAVMAVRKDHHLPAHLHMMLQAAIPIYLGDITPTFLQLVVHTYRSYLERLANIHKQNMMAIKSTVLKNVNMSGIDVNDDDEDAHVKDSEAMKTEINIAENLIENCEIVIQSIKTKMTSTLSHEEIEDLTSEGKASGSFFGGSEEKVNPNKQNMIISKAVQAIEMLKQIPLLQGAGLDLAQQLGRIDNKLTYPLVMEGRIQMQALKYQLLRIESGDRGARENMAPVYNLAVVAYRKALKLTSKTTPKKSDLPVLTEFGNLTHYGFIHRDLMRFTMDGIHNLVKLGKESVDAAVTVDDSFVPLQKRLESSLTQLSLAADEASLKVRLS
ncbi:MAG: hypothetical protein H8E38_04040 [SAR324 cluster bacterium]|nr:hypothetical protein [SAR324 cluster bacterium]MBL7035296.1 hypothetical protein [SAR324 cluster bacterium]